VFALFVVGASKDISYGSKLPSARGGGSRLADIMRIVHAWRYQRLPVRLEPEPNFVHVLTT
jgi:hypothetical protein